MSKDMNLEYSKKETFILLLAILQIHVLRRGLLPLYRFAWAVGYGNLWV